MVSERQSVGASDADRPSLAAAEAPCMPAAVTSTRIAPIVARVTAHFIGIHTLRGAGDY